MIWRPIASWFPAFIFLLAGFITLALFLTTSAPIPCEFHPWGLDCLDSTYDRLDASGRILACPGDQIVALHSVVPTTQPGIFEIDGLNREIDFSKALLEVWSWQESDVQINTFGGIAGFRRLSANEGVIAQYDGASITFYSWPGQPVLSKIERDGVSMPFYSWPDQAKRGQIKLDRDCTALAFSHNGRRVITREADSQVKVWDIASGIAISTWSHDGALNPLHIYFDADDQPKLVWASASQGYAKADIFTKKQEITFDESLSGRIMPRNGASAIDAKLSSLACPLGRSELGVWSLDDGKLLYRYDWPDHELIECHFSPNGRFLACTWDGEFDCEHFLGKRFSGIVLEWIETTSFYHRIRGPVFTVHDTMSGQNWRGWENAHAALFSNDGTKMYSFEKDGRYTWDLPPRWRLFTPWAWASLAAWIGIAWGWKGLRAQGRESRTDRERNRQHVP